MPGLKRRRTSGTTETTITRRSTPRYTRTGTQLMDTSGITIPRTLVFARSGGIPDRMYPVKHRIFYSVEINPADVTPVAITKAINNLGESFNSHQPMYYDQFNAMYNFFKVTKAKFTVHFSQTGNTASSDGATMVGIQFTENSSWTPANIATIIERGNVSYKPIALSNGMPSVVTVKKTWDLAKWYGPENSKGLSVSGTNAAAPTEVVYAHIWAGTGYTSANPAAVIAHITIDYEVEWYGPLQTNQS